MEQTVGRHPEWLRAAMPGGPAYSAMRQLLCRLALTTVCEEARCPNIGECYAEGTATFMILGNSCTRRCAFCAVDHGSPDACSPAGDEPQRLSQAVAELCLRHVVITSVTRDDLDDGGSGHFAACAGLIRQSCPGVRIEVLIPDFGGSAQALETVLRSPVDILNHNIETVPRLYRRVRPQAKYARSIELLRMAKEMDRNAVTKTGMMLGLGEAESDIEPVLRDLVETKVDILTLGQYLRPTMKHLPVDRYVTPGEFARWKEMGEAMGLRHVESGPLVRSSYHAWSQVRKLRR